MTTKKKLSIYDIHTIGILALMVGIGACVVLLIYQFGVMGGWRWHIVEEKIGTVVELGQCTSRSKTGGTCAWAAQTPDGLVYRATGGPKIIGQQVKITIYVDRLYDENRLLFRADH